MSDTLVRFKKWQKENPNFITPTLVKAKETNGNIIELSEGTDFDHNPAFGVTVIKTSDGSFKTTMGKENKSFTGTNARKQAEQHFQKIATSKKYWK